MDFRENRLFSGSETMGRFSKYELHEVEEVKKTKEEMQELINADEVGKVEIYRPAQYYIVPAKDAEYLSNPYNAFQDYPDILADFLDMGSDLDEKSILNFCNRYGLFNLSGFYSANFGAAELVDHDGDNYSAYDYEWVLLSNRGMQALGHGDKSSDMMHIKEYANYFFPDSWYGYNKIISNSNLQSILSRNFYCEPIYYLEEEIYQRYILFSNWIKDAENGKNPNELCREYAGKIMTNPVSVTLDYNRGWIYNWVYKSLFDAIDIMFINNIIESNESVKLCKNCNSAFIASKQSHQYCSDRCNNAARQRRFQQKKKNREN